MKSWISPTPSSVRKRVMRTFVSGKYSCFGLEHSTEGEIRKYPPRSASRIDPNTLGESKCGAQYQSIVPSVPTSATVCRSPITPCSAMGR